MMSMLRWLLGLALLLHGLIHLVGVAHAFWPALGPALQREVSQGFALLWLVTAVLLVAAAVMLFGRSPYWWVAAAPALPLSQVLIVMWWTDARFGTIANVLLLLPVIAAAAAVLPGGLPWQFRARANEGLDRGMATRPVTDADLAPLPDLVQRYLRFVGVIGKDRVFNFRASFSGEIATSRDAGLSPFQAEQFTFFEPPTRLFLIEAARAGIPFQALHQYVGREATMRVRVASLIPVVHAAGPEMNRSETVTMFNDMCLLAPATLIDPGIGWQVIDTSSVRATFSNAGNTISALLSFAADGSLANFSSDDRSQTSDGKSYLLYRWSTPVRNYREYHGFRLAAEGDATWHEPAGDFTYVKMKLRDIQYNRHR
jgi:hypothetical protein